MVDGEECTVLCPLADMANHDFALGCDFTKKYNPDTQMFEICYKKGPGCKAGDELFFKYGEVCNAQQIFRWQPTRRLKLALAGSKLAAVAMLRVRR
jgi:hypothetical protein